MESGKLTSSTKFLRRSSEPGQEAEPPTKLPPWQEKMARTNGGAITSSHGSSIAEPRRQDAKATRQLGWTSKKWHSNNKHNTQNSPWPIVQHSKIMSACEPAEQQAHREPQVSDSKRELYQLAVTTKAVQRPTVLLAGRQSGVGIDTAVRRSNTIRKEKGSPKKESEVQAQEGRLRLHLTTLKPNANDIVAYYNRKCGLRSVPVFIFNSQDEYIRRILLSWGWSENRVFDSPFFNLKWTYKDSPKDYSVLVPGQLVNHFLNNQEMTSKGRLAINLRSNSEEVIPHDSYFPRCFDLGNPTDQSQFRSEYQKNVAFIVLRRIYQHVRLRLPEAEFDELQRRLTQRLNLKEKRLPVASSGFSMEGGSFGLMRFEDHQNKRSDFLMQINLSVMVFRYLRQLKQRNKFCPRYKSNHLLNFRRDQFQRVFPRLQHYARMANPFQPGDVPDFTKEFFATPSALFIYLTVKYHTYFESFEGNSWKTAGDNNVWIVKPASNSRGNGIHLSRDLEAILNTSEGITNRIVQKYIERPLIFKGGLSRLINRKFDLRQWVLVTSYSPLRVFRFSECYLRICSDTYEPEQIKQLQRHLTNYSFNKQHFSNQADSVASLDELRDVLRAERGCDYDTQLLPRIDEIIKEVMRRCSEHVVPSSHSFEMYGFDILIDELLTPWLLEVNMSPACEERCQFLRDYCEVMGQKMLRKVLPPETIPSGMPPLNGCFNSYDWVPLCMDRTVRPTMNATAVSTARPAVQTSRIEEPERADTEVALHFSMVEDFRSDSVKTQASELQGSIVRSNRIACLEEDAALTIQTIYKSIRAMRMLRQLKQQRHANTLSRYLNGFLTQQKYEYVQASADDYQVLSESFVYLMAQVHTDKLYGYLKAFAQLIQYQRLTGDDDQSNNICQPSSEEENVCSKDSTPRIRTEAFNKYLKGFLEQIYFQDKYENCFLGQSVFTKPLSNIEVRRSFERILQQKTLVSHHVLMAKYVGADLTSEDPAKSPINIRSEKKRSHRSTLKRSDHPNNELTWDLTPYLDQRCTFRKHSVKVRHSRPTREHWQ